jgi:tripartite-type tricarboxylate transporter receptor subunit TctC
MLLDKKILSAAMVMMLVPHTVSAQSVESFYKGQQVTMIVNSRPGGGSDSYARLVAKNLGRFLPGKPGFITKNMPGGGGLAAVNYLFSVARQDGSEVGIFNADGIIQSLLGNTNARFDPTRFNWIGSVNNEVPVTVLWHTAPVKTMAEVFTTETIVGGTGADYKNEILPRFYNRYLGTKFKVIGGYEGSTGHILLAMQRGEVYGNAAWSYSSVLLQAGNFIKSGELRVILQAGQKRIPSLQGVPWVYDYVKDERTRQIMDLMLAAGNFTRAFGAPPGVPTDRTQALRVAFAAMFEDPSFLDDAEKMKLPVDFTSGKEIDEILAMVSRIPADILEAAKVAMEHPNK